MRNYNLSELLSYTADVIVGKRKALDVKSAQPVGPKDDLSSFSQLIQLSLVMLVALLLAEYIGKLFGSMAGLKRGKLKRFASTFSELVYYTFSVFCLSTICWSSKWFWPSGWSEVMYDGRVQNIPDLEAYTVPADLKCFYLFETSYYFSSFILLLVRKKKKDFSQMAFHHIVTSLLLLLSYSTGYIRIGAVVMILHNVFDPFMLVAKCTHYMNVPLVPDIAFACCTITFAVSRLYYYPLSIYFAWIGVCTGNTTCSGGVWDKTLVEFSLIGLLAALLPVHLIWFKMILKVLQSAVLQAGVKGDVRSDSEDEDEPAHSKDHTKVKKRQ